MPVVDDPLCSDEDLLLRAGTDFALLCPPDQLAAQGEDGVFDGTRTVLSSPSNDFVFQGVLPGMAAQWYAEPATRYSDEVSIVAAVAAHDLTLRRKGFAEGGGVPPGRGAPDSGVTFRVLSLDRQIRTASYEVRRWLGVDPDSGLLDPFDLRSAVVLTVLADRYADRALQAGEAADDFMAKARYYRGLLAEERTRLDLLYRPELAGGLRAGTISLPHMIPCRGGRGEWGS